MEPDGRAFALFTSLGLPGFHIVYGALWKGFCSVDNPGFTGVSYRVERLSNPVWVMSTGTVQKMS
jgi:hypothetical protein